MKEKCKLKKAVLILVVNLILLSFTACGAKKEPVKPDKDPAKVVQDKNYTEDLKQEKEVEGGQVYVQDNMVIATMVIKEGISEADAKALAEKYAQELKKTYKDMPVNVQAVQKGKNVANIMLEK